MGVHILSWEKSSLTHPVFDYHMLEISRIQTRISNGFTLKKYYHLGNFTVVINCTKYQ